VKKVHRNLSDIHKIMMLCANWLPWRPDQCSVNLRVPLGFGPLKRWSVSERVFSQTEFLIQIVFSSFLIIFVQIKVSVKYLEGFLVKLLDFFACLHKLSLNVMHLCTVRVAVLIRKPNTDRVRVSGKRFHSKVKNV